MLIIGIGQCCDGYSDGGKSGDADERGVRVFFIGESDEEREETAMP